VGKHKRRASKGAGKRGKYAVLVILCVCFILLVIKFTPAGRYLLDFITEANGVRTRAGEAPGTRMKAGEAPVAGADAVSVSTMSAGANESGNPGSGGVAMDGAKTGDSVVAGDIAAAGGASCGLSGPDADPGANSGSGSGDSGSSGSGAGVGGGSGSGSATANADADSGSGSDADTNANTSDDGMADDSPTDDDLTDDDPDERWKRYFAPVPETAPVGEEYFSDALFIGDSRVMGLMLYSGLTGSTFYSQKGINITNLLTEPIVMQTGGAKISVSAALGKCEFAKIYLKAGLNELGWKNISMFTQAYADVIEKIRAAQPDAVIYVQSILPVTKSKNDKDPIFNNARIMEFNEAIKKMTYEKGVAYLDVYGALTDDEGFMPEQVSIDGVHLKKEHCQLWLDYLKKHTVNNSGT